MKIAIDARAYNWAGIGRCIRNLLMELANNPAAKQHHFIIVTSEENRQEIASNFDYDNWDVRVVNGSYYSFQEQTILLTQLYAIDADIWHFMHFNMPIFFRRPYIVTIHDTTRFVFPGQKRQSLWQQVAYEYVFKQSVESAKAIVCSSENTQKELQQLPFKLSRNVQSIHWGLEEKFAVTVADNERQKVRMLLDTADDFLLFVGVWMNHKNLPRLLKAFKLLLKDYPDMKLVLTGKPKPGYNNMVETARKLNLLDNIIFPGFVPDKLLPALYAEAACFVFPSLYEGFGFPALEAAASGTPVVTSNVSCMPEVMGDMAEYVNPEYVPSITDGIMRALRRSSHNQEKRSAWSRQFNWQEVAKQYLDVYVNVEKSK